MNFSKWLGQDASGGTCASFVPTEQVEQTEQTEQMEQVEQVEQTPQQPPRRPSPFLYISFGSSRQAEYIDTEKSAFHLVVCTVGAKGSLSILQFFL
jgi:hypothetical protein